MPRDLLASNNQPRDLLAESQPKEPAPRTRTEAVMRQLGLTGRAIAEGAAEAVSPLTNPLRNVINAGFSVYDRIRPPRIDELVTGKQSSFYIPRIEDSTSQVLTEAGVPQAENGIEQGVQGVGRLASSIVIGGGLTNLAARGAGLTAVRQVPGAVPNAQTDAARTLAKEGIPLDRSQRTGGRFAAMLRSAVSNHPFTAERQANFTAAQQKAFNRAVLRSIGESSDEATQSVMSSAKSRIGAMFDQIGRKGAQFDDTLQSQVAAIVDDARATVPQSELAPLLKNIDDLLAGVDDAGKINGDIFIRLRSRLSNLSQRPGVGQAARELEDAMLDALERTHPGQRRVLSEAKDQWRNLRIIANSIAKGSERDISPLRLSNQLGSMRNQNMSVFGQGGDQSLVRLAQAGRDVLPQAIPDSGTIPRGLMQAPIRAIATAPLYRGAQNYLLSQGTSPLNPVRNALVAGGQLAEPR